MDSYEIADLPPELAARITVHPVTGCWIWEHKSGPAPDKYGSVQWGGSCEAIHRKVYKLLVGPIPEAHDLDHVYAWGCRYKACCWPGHLEPVTRGENSARSQRANVHKGVAKTVRLRVAAGCPTGNDVALAAWHELEASA